MAIPSQARKHFREGVETRRAAPKPYVRNGEGIVQTTNPHMRGGESRSGMKIRRPQGREGSIPSARTTPAFQADEDGTILARFSSAGLRPLRRRSGGRCRHFCIRIRLHIPANNKDFVGRNATQRDAAFNPIWISIVELFSISAGPANRLPVITARSIDFPREMCRFL